MTATFLHFSGSISNNRGWIRIYVYIYACIQLSTAQHSTAQHSTAQTMSNTERTTRIHWNWNQNQLLHLHIHTNDNTNNNSNNNGNSSKPKYNESHDIIEGEAKKRITKLEKWWNLTVGKAWDENLHEEDGTIKPFRRVAFVYCEYHSVWLCQCIHVCVCMLRNGDDRWLPMFIYIVCLCSCFVCYLAIERDSMWIQMWRTVPACLCVCVCVCTFHVRTCAFVFVCVCMSCYSMCKRALYSLFSCDLLLLLLPLLLFASSWVFCPLHRCATKRKTRHSYQAKHTNEEY